MKTIIKSDEEQQQTLITFVIDWNESDSQSKVKTVLGLYCAEDMKVEVK